jgi:taurine dioxygenase
MRSNRATSARHPDPAVLGPDPAQISERDLFFQTKMLAERLAFAAAKAADPPPSAARQPRRPTGPRHGVMAELRRIDPSGSRQVSAATEAQCAALGWSLEHRGVTIGTVIHGPDLCAAQSRESIAAINAVLLERKVVCFRGQHLSEQGQIEFGEHWGALEVFPFAVADNDLGVDPQIHRFHVGSKGAGAAPPALLQGESTARTKAEHRAVLQRMGAKKPVSGWHSDVTWRKTPSLGSMLYCDIAPPFGGATSFSDCYAAWQGLAEDEQAALRGRHCMHDFDHFRRGQVNSGVSEATAEELRLAYPQARHPIVRTHPETGGEMLYVNPVFGRYIEEPESGAPMDQAESDAILGHLYAQVG